MIYEKIEKEWINVNIHIHEYIHICGRKHRQPSNNLLEFIEFIFFLDNQSSSNLRHPFLEIRKYLDNLKDQLSKELLYCVVVSQPMFDQ